MAEPRPIHLSGYARRSNDLYATPAWVTEALLRHVSLRGPVWEPCCGAGAMARVLATAGYRVVSTDIADHGFGTPGVDIFSCQAMPDGCRAIVTNPPYGDADGQRRSATALLDFVRHVLMLAQEVQGQVALVVRFQWIAGQRAAALLSSAPFVTVIALTRRIRWFDMGAQTNQAQHHHAWIVFDYHCEKKRRPEILFAP